MTFKWTPPIASTWHPVWLLTFNIAAWGVIHVGTGYYVHRLPQHRLERDPLLLKQRSWERGGKVYDRLNIRQWKERVPEAGAFFAGGVSKRAIPDRSTQALEAFAVETRRAEIGHWLAAIAGPLFILWNTLPVTAVMVLYGIVVNLPFIIIQRYNRFRINRILERRTKRAASR